MKYLTVAEEERRMNKGFTSEVFPGFLFNKDAIILQQYSGKYCEFTIIWFDSQIGNWYMAEVKNVSTGSI